MDEETTAWIAAQQAAGQCPVTAALERAFALAAVGSSDGRDAWMAVAEAAARAEPPSTSTA